MGKTTTKRTVPSLYSVHPSVAMLQKWIDDLPAKSGRNLEQWLALVKKSGPKGEAARAAWLKKEHDLGTNAAAWIAARAEGKRTEDEDPDEYLKAAARHVEAQYAGKKAALRPIYDALLDLGLSIAKDVKACPCKTMVPLFRHHVIAEIKPATLTRVDFGLALRDTKTPARLIDTGGFAKKDRITHRIAITSLGDVDGEVEKWLRKAYALDA
jgi:hypothetical protein